jgi:hypothetical protein
VDLGWLCGLGLFAGRSVLQAVLPAPPHWTACRVGERHSGSLYLSAS